MAGGFFAARLRGIVALERLFWTDMVLVGTLINVAAMFGAVLALGFKAPLWLSIVIDLAPMPYNVFLAFAVSHTARELPPKQAAAYRAGALLWLAASVLI